MRKIITTTSITLDGVMQAPGGPEEDKTGGFAYGGTSSNNAFLIPGANSSLSGTISGFTFSCASGATPPGVCYAGSDKKTVTGWTAGAGAEYAIASNWTVRAEYLHIDLGGQTVRLVSPSPPSSPNVFLNYSYNHEVVDIVRLGVNYKFGGGAVVAKY